jgi:hypothetical protein
MSHGVDEQDEPDAEQEPDDVADDESHDLASRSWDRFLGRARYRHSPAS